MQPPCDGQERLDARRMRMVQGAEEVVESLYWQVHTKRHELWDFNNTEFDLQFINSVVRVIKNFQELSIQDMTGFLIIEYAFKRNVYFPLAQFLACQNVLDNKKALYNPNRLLEGALAQDYNLENVQLLLKQGASNSVPVAAPMHGLNGIESVYMLPVTAYARTGDIPRLSLFLHNNVDCNIRNKQDNPLYCVISNPRDYLKKDLINLLLYHGADPYLRFSNEELGIRGRTPLECAAQLARCNPDNTLYQNIYDVLKNGHRRRTQAMASYLFRIINGKRFTVEDRVDLPLGIDGKEFPLELCYYIVSMNYGPLMTKPLWPQLKDHTKTMFKRKGRKAPVRSRYDQYLQRT